MHMPAMQRNAGIARSSWVLQAATSYAHVKSTALKHTRRRDIGAGKPAKTCRYWQFKAARQADARTAPLRRGKTR